MHSQTRLQTLLQLPLLCQARRRSGVRAHKRPKALAKRLESAGTITITTAEKKERVTAQKSHPNGSIARSAITLSPIDETGVAENDTG